MRIFRNVENLKNFKCVTSHTNATFLIYYAIAIKEAVTNRRMKNSPGEVSGRDCECRLKYCPANMLKHNFSGDTYEKGFKIPSQHNISKRFLMFHILLDQIISKHDSIGTFTFEQVEKLTLFIIDFQLANFIKKN